MMGFNIDFMVIIESIVCMCFLVVKVKFYLFNYLIEFNILLIF